MRLLDVKPSTAKGKKYTATFCMCNEPPQKCKGKKVHFGSSTSQTYLDHHDKAKRAAYIARHRVREDFNKPMTAGSLSFHLLWGKTTSLKENIAYFKKKFDC